MNKRRVSVRISPLRAVLWTLGLVLIAYILFESSKNPLGGKLPTETNAGAESGGGPGLVPGDGSAPRPSGPPAVRLGALNRCAHLSILSGIELNLFAMAAIQRGWVESSVFDRARSLRTALAEGEIDVAALPLRDAVALYLEHGESAPVIVAGIARGDEMVVVRAGLDDLSLARPGDLRIGVIEPPILDVRATLRIGDDDGARPLLKSADSFSGSLAAREIDVALLPEPFAHGSSTLSGSKVLTTTESTAAGAELVGGAVLVISRAFLASDPGLCESLVQANELSTFNARSDLGTAIERAIVTLRHSKQSTPPALIWGRAMQSIELGTDIPREDLQALLELGGAERSTEPPPLDALIDERYLQLAREVAEEALGK